RHHGKRTALLSDPVGPLQVQERSSPGDRLDVGETADQPERLLTVRVQLPGTESLELQVSGQTLVSELHQRLMDHQVTCHRTCFSLHFGPIRIDGRTELGSVPGMKDGGALMKLGGDSYSVRDARLHLRHVGDLFRSLDAADAYDGVNGRSLSPAVTVNTGQRKESVSKRGSCVDHRPPDHVLPGCKDRPLTPLQPVRDDRKWIQCLRVLNMSSWNPPPGNRKMHGDLLYLSVLTLEDKELNITSSTRGFYLNQSTAFVFNPKPAVPRILCHSLVDLLSQISPCHDFRSHLLPSAVTQTVHLDCTPQGAHTGPCPNIDAFSLLQPQSRDWNEELQGSRELPRNSLQERLLRDQTVFKTSSDFVAVATRGAVAVIDGSVMPLNPSDPPHMQMFIWKNLFFSLGFDVSEHYQSLGGDAAAHAAALCDLRGVEAYTRVDTPGLHTLGTALVDYKGIRVIAQILVPGILEKNQDQVVYGSNDCGATVSTHPRFLELLDKTSKSLRVQRHLVLDQNNVSVELCSAVETKGIVGNDGRCYILDLLRTFPPDLNFQFSEEEEVPEECRRFGFPWRHRHSLASLRAELLEAFVQHRRRVVSEACRAVGSVRDSDFDLRFNPDVFVFTGVRFPSDAETRTQRKLLWDAAASLLTNQIPALLRSCLVQSSVPMDGSTLTSVLHQHGVNVRYLGVVLKELHRVEGSQRLDHIKRISISEVLSRSVKHIFRVFLQDVEPAAFSAAVSHFLNCLLSSSTCVLLDSCSDELHARRRYRRRRSQGSRPGLSTECLWARLTPTDLWTRIRTEAEDYYHYTIHSKSMDDVVEKYGVQRISMLREISMKTGIQVRLRDYVFDSRHRPVFVEDDIVNMFPVVKHLRHTCTDASRLMQRAQVVVQQGERSHTHTHVHLQEVLLLRHILSSFSDVAACLRLLGRLSYILEDHVDALSLQERAVMCSERVHGVDHPQTIEDYTYLALYYFSGGQHSTSLQLLYRARYLTLLVSGEDHPQVALLDSMLGLVLHGLMDHELSLKFLHSALCLTSKYHGVTSLRHAHSHHLLATVYEAKGDFRSALKHENEAFQIYKVQVGENHTSTKESSEYLKDLTQQAVLLQKSISHLYSNTDGACIPPPQIFTPSFPTILQQLNLTCGVVLIPLRNNTGVMSDFVDPADLRTEMNRKETFLVEELEKQRKQKE
uniref:Clustered mitochondria homolog n=1 Tax=Cynoglossus semilaevis TaxID=244447 RepID=A0A3P8VG81_CYNSE